MKIIKKYHVNLFVEPDTSCDYRVPSLEAARDKAKDVSVEYERHKGHGNITIHETVGEDQRAILGCDLGSRFFYKVRD